MQRLIDRELFRNTSASPHWERLLPELMGRLLRGMTEQPLSDLRIPVGQNYKVTGLDGQVTLQERVGPIPAGRVLFEFGTEAVTADFKSKADHEYKRLSSFGTKVPNLVFVMVGRAVWDVVETEHKNKKIVGRKFWIDERLAEKGNPFQDIVVIDQVMLIDWLTRDVDTAVWLLSELDQSPSPKFGVRSLGRRVEMFQRGFSIGVSPELLIEQQSWTGALIDKVQGDKRQIPLFGNTSEEAAVAACHLVNAQQRKFELPAIYVSSEEGVKLLEGVPQKHIVIVEGDVCELAKGALEQHQLVLCQPISPRVVTGQPLVIATPTAEIFAAHLDDSLGFDQRLTIAKGYGRTLTALRREFSAGDPGFPLWCDPDHKHSRLLKLLTLVGGWNKTKISDPGDAGQRRRQFKDVDLILGRSGEPNDRNLEELVGVFGREPNAKRGATDPLFRSTRNVVAISAPVDALFRIAGQLTDHDYEELEQMLIEVVGHRAQNIRDPDELYDPAKEQSYSSSLIGGLILTFVLISVFGHRPPLNLRIDGQSSEVWCQRVYRKIIPELSEFPQYTDALREWQSLLAEGVPYAFLQSLEDLLEGHPEVVSSMFEVRERQFGFGHFHMATTLLFALERLAWNEEFLERISVLLMRMHNLSKPFDKKVGNTPAATLQTILYPGLAQTGANAAQRMEVFHRLAKDFGNDVLDLFIPLLDTRGGWVTSTTKPLFTQVIKAEDTWHDVWATRDLLADLAIEVAAGRADDLKQLVDPCSGFREEAYDNFIGALKKLNPEDGGITGLRDELRDFVGRHSQFPEADWSMNDERLSKLTLELDRLQPSSLARFEWLFDKPYVNLHLGDYQAQETELENLRKDAAQSVLSYGPSACLEFMDNCGTPSVAAAAIGAAALSTEDVLYLCSIVTEPVQAPQSDDNAPSILHGLSRGALTAFGADWLATLRNRVPQLSAEKLEWLGSGLYTTPVTVDLMCNDEFPFALRNGFWKNVNVYSFFRASLPEKGVQALLKAGRAHEMAALVSKGENVVTEEVGIQIAKSYAEHLAKAYSEGRSGDGLATYNLWKMLAHLEKTGSMTLEEIALIEFPFARLFRFDGPEGETAIHRVLARDPKQVIELAKARYKSDAAVDEKDLDNQMPEDEKEDFTPETKQTIYHLLDTFSVLPGRDGDQIDSVTLEVWVKELFSLATSEGYTKAASLILGELLSHAPEDPDDGVWPHKAVRDILEAHANEYVSSSFITKQFNERGVVVGSMEVHSLESHDHFKSQAEKLSAWPVTQDILNQIAHRDLHRAEWDRQRELDNSVGSGLR